MLSLSTLVVAVVVTNSLFYVNSMTAVGSLAKEYRVQLATRVVEAATAAFGAGSGALLATIEMLQRTGLCHVGAPASCVGFRGIDFVEWTQSVSRYQRLGLIYAGDEKYGVIVGGGWQEAIIPNYTDCVASPRPRPTKCLHEDYFVEDTGNRTDSGAFNYDPRLRPWYTQIFDSPALKSGATRMKWSDVYVDASKNILVVTAAGAYQAPFTAGTANPVFAGVVAVDFTLDALSSFVASIKVGRGGVGSAFIANTQWKLLSSSSAANHSIVVGEGAAAVQRDCWNSSDPRIRGSALAYARLPNITEGAFTHTSFTAGGVRYSASATRWKDPFSLDLIVVVVIPESEYLHTISRQTTRTIIIAAAIVLASLIVTVFGVGLVTRPLARFSATVAALGELNLTPSDVKTNIREIVEMEQSLNRARKGLRSFTKFVPSRVVRRLLLDKESEVALGVKQKICVVMFCDVQGFTRISEQITSARLIELLSEVFEAITNIVERNDGVIDKFIGDCAMAFWGAPNSIDHAEDRALLSALEIQEAVSALREKWNGMDGMPKGFRVRIGIHVGPVLAGIVGAPSRFSYTVVGDTVNVASRLEGACKKLSLGIACSSQVRLRASKSKFSFRSVDRTQLPGRKGVVDLVEVLDISDGSGSLSSRNPGLGLAYEKAYALYIQRDFEGALKLFKEAQLLEPDDIPIKIMVGRCERFRKNPPSEAWDGNANDEFSANN